MELKKQQLLFGEILKSHNLITEAQLEQALQAQQKSGHRLGDVLIELGYISNQDVLMALSIQSTMEFVDLKAIEIPLDVIQKVSASMAKVYKVLPVRFADNTLTVAMADTLNVNILDDIRFMLGCEVKGVLCEPQEILSLINKHYGAEADSVENLLQKIDDQRDSQDAAGPVGLKEEDIQNIEGMVNEAPVVRLLNLILIQAVKDQASDIHFEPFEDSFRVRYRIDGMLFEMSPPPKHLSLAISSRIKVMSNMDIAEKRLPQDGRISVNVQNRNIDLRVSTLPTVFGESIVMRVLDRGSTALDYRQLGLEKNDVESFLKVIRKPNGILLITGPTGSGKTTTLYSMMKELNSIDTKIITTEDPVEYELSGVVQIPVNAKINLTFARCLRAILRQDPDIIMVGEIRDVETAQIAVQASLTGHLVLSTLHTNDAPTAITRLVDMGIEPFLIASTVECVVAQRLVRNLCLECREAYVPDPYIIETLGLKPDECTERQFYRPRGCPKCNNTGYRGRCGVFEFLMMTDAIRELILERRPASDLRHIAMKQGMRLLRQDAIRRMFDGTTSFDEVIRET